MEVSLELECPECEEITVVIWDIEEPITMRDLYCRDHRET